MLSKTGPRAEVKQTTVEN